MVLKWNYMQALQKNSEAGNDEKRGKRIHGKKHKINISKIDSKLTIPKLH